MVIKGVMPSIKRNRYVLKSACRLAVRSKFCRRNGVAAEAGRGRLGAAAVQAHSDAVLMIMIMFFLIIYFFIFHFALI